MTDTIEDCFYCGLPHSKWGQGCAARRDRLHWTAAQRIGTLELEQTELLTTLKVAQRLILAGARAMSALEVRGRRAGKKARREALDRCDSLELETEAAKISDTFAVMHDDSSLPVGLTFDRLEGR